MRKLTLITLSAVFLLTSCGPKITRRAAYPGLYDEHPLTVLIMPPINRTTNVEAKAYFHSTLNIPIVEAGYYVIPPFLSMDILKRESAYDSELFINAGLERFGEVFGADLVVFTIIHTWRKSGLASNVYVEVEYIIKSTKTNEVVYTRHANVTYDASVASGGGLMGIAANAISTAATKYVDVARLCNNVTFSDLPNGKYGTTHMSDSTEIAGKKTFRATVK